MRNRIFEIIAISCLIGLVVYGVTLIAIVFMTNQEPSNGEMISGILSLGFAGLIATWLYR